MLHFCQGSPSPRATALLWSVVFFVALCPLHGEEGGFSRGNRLYAEGRYPEAAEAYEGDVRQGKYTANLFYNLANAYHRRNEEGRAILNYRRALLLEPTHSEAAANLAFVRGQVGPEPPRKPTGALEPVRGFLAGGGADLYVWLAAAGGWLAVVASGWAVLRPRTRGGSVTAAAVGVALCLGCVGISFLLDDGRRDVRRAVILSDRAPVLYAPADNAKTIVQLPVGGEVRVLLDRGPWLYIRIPDGARGWMPSSKAERVTPTQTQERG